LLFCFMCFSLFKIALQGVSITLCIYVPGVSLQQLNFAFWYFFCQYFYVEEI
jgi:hypothetical protein